MFRIESYITSIILSYVDRYIKNFRQQDAQVSLWEGDGSFQNLNLDLEVLEQELNLPFSFVSGHIHELLIHVPWTRLTSEPVQITINTIECVMKLKPVGSQQQQAKPPPRKNPRAVEDPQSQSSLTSSLVNKIVCNLSVTCNNLILKYVEEDIVLSMNIKTLSFGTVNSNWEPAFMELSPTQLDLRKLISLSDVTVCLDKRNASGRIESYLEPLLYRCFMTVRLWQSYASMSAKRASSTRLDVLCESMAFTVSEPQLPMLMRLAALCLALHRKQLSQTNIPQPADDPGADNSEDDAIVGEPSDAAESWSSWALSWMPSVVPLPDFDDDTDDTLYSDSSVPANNTLNIGFYIHTLALALKLCEADGSGGLKTQTQGFMQVTLKGCRVDLFSHNNDWTNIQMGISEATVKPEGDCCCGVSELAQLVYLSSGSVTENFLSGSLFDKQPSTSQDRDFSSWKYHLEAVSETIMLEKTPAVAVDYLSCIQDKTEDEESDEEDDDERLPCKEKVLIRYVAGPVVIRLCSGLIHRIQMLMKTCSSYDYIPYTATTTVLPVVQDNQVLDLVHRLSEKSIEMDEDLYSRYLPIHTSQFTAFHTIVELYPANHLPVHMSALGRKISRSQRRVVNASSTPSSPPPCVTLEWTCAFATLTRPLYPDKILLMASKFHKDKLPDEIVNTSLTRLAFKAVSVSSSVRLPFLQAMKVVEVSSVSSEQTWHSLITPLEENINSDIGVHVENVTITCSKAKLVLLCETISSLIATNNRQRYLAAHFTIYNTSLIYDAATTTDTIYLKLIVELLKVRRVLTALSETTCLSVSACQVFATRLLEKGEEWETMIVSAPEANTPSSVPLLEVVYQQPSCLNVFAPVVTLKLREVRFSADPLLYSWLLYSPTPTASFSAHSTTLKPHKSAE